MDQPTEAVLPHVPTSAVLECLIDEVPPGRVTLVWLTNHLHKRSFGIVLLLLGVCGLIPLVSQVAALLLVFPAVEMMRAQAVPSFPRRVAELSVSRDKLTAMLRRIVPKLHYLERFIRPRWRTPLRTTKRVTGAVALLLAFCLLAPLPLVNVPVSLTIILVAFAYLEEDGILLAVSLLISMALFVLGAEALRGTIAELLWLIRPH